MERPEAMMSPRSARIFGAACLASFASACAGGPVPDERAQPAAEAVSQLKDFFPERAIRTGISGRASVRCQVQGDGSLTACAVTAEAPPGYAFGLATIRVAERFFHATPPAGPKPVFATVSMVWKNPG
jgi:TonB family protein